MDFDELFLTIRSLINSAHSGAARTVNSIQVITNFEIGRHIVEYEQSGQATAVYGKKVIDSLAERLTREYGSGFSRSNLFLFRKFYTEYRNRDIGQIIDDKGDGRKGRIVQSMLGQSSTAAAASLSGPGVFPLGWTHYIALLKIKDWESRAFYEIEAAQASWTVRELERQIGASLYERLLLSRDKAEVKRLSREGQRVEKPADVLKNPYILEFLGLDEKAAYSETDLESAIIDKLEHFLLELGKGFLFEARQKRFTFDNDHFYVDLVFYNRLLRCYVLIDLKTDKLSHQDLGQMQMYVNYFDRHVKRTDENRTVGIILCRRKNDAMVEITLPQDANIHASEYQFYLPSREELRLKLMEWEGEGNRPGGDGQE